MAGYYTLIGEREKALDLVVKAIDLGYINYPFLVFHHPLYGPLRTEPRFITLMDDVKKKWEAFDIHV